MTDQATSDPTPTRSRTECNRVPSVTPEFWLIKLMAVTMGETAADYLAVNLGLGLTTTSLIMSAILVGALVLQFGQERYVPWSYWLAVVLISIVGTLVTDNLVDNFGVSLVTTTVFFTGALLRHLRGLVCGGTHPVDPRHLHHAARGLLLAGDPVHLRARHCGRRPCGRAFRPWLHGDGCACSG